MIMCNRPHPVHAQVNVGHTQATDMVKWKYDVFVTFVGVFKWNEILFGYFMGWKL